MHILRTDPWTLLNGVRPSPDRLRFADRAMPAPARFTPAVDIREFDDRFEIVADIPGVAADQLQITLDEGVLTLAGERQPPAADTAELHRSERAAGAFRRRFRLPDSVAADGLAAACADGVLTVTIPKLPPPLPRRIEVKVN